MQDNKRKIIRGLLIVFAAFIFIKLIMSFKKNTSINELTESKRLVSTEIVKLEKNIISVPVYGKLFSLKEINKELVSIYGEKISFTPSKNHIFLWMFPIIILILFIFFIRRKYKYR